VYAKRLPNTPLYWLKSDKAVPRLSKSAVRDLSAELTSYRLLAQAFAAHNGRHTFTYRTYGTRECLMTSTRYECSSRRKETTDGAATKLADRTILW
jgi:hypothetical protein